MQQLRLTRFQQQRLGLEWDKRHILYSILDLSVRKSRKALRWVTKEQQTDLDSFSVFLVKRANVESICSVDFPTRWNQRWRVFLEVNLAPVNALEKRMVLNFKCSEQMQTF